MYRDCDIVLLGVFTNILAAAKSDQGICSLFTKSLDTVKYDIQSTLVISNLLISNYRLYRSEILVPVLTWQSKNS